MKPAKNHPAGTPATQTAAATPKATTPAAKPKATTQPAKPVAAANPNAERVKELNQQGSKAFMSNDLEGARRAWAQAHELDPANEEITRNLNRVDAKIAASKAPAPIAAPAPKPVAVAPAPVAPAPIAAPAPKPVAVAPAPVAPAPIAAPAPKPVAVAPAPVAPAPIAAPAPKPVAVAPAPVIAAPPAVTPVPGSLSLAEAKAAFDGGQAIFVDARLPNGFVFGHVPGAVNLPGAQFEEAFAVKGTALPRDKKVIVYCADAHCPEMQQAFLELGKKGFTSVLKMPDGWYGWTAANYPRQRGFTTTP